MQISTNSFIWIGLFKRIWMDLAYFIHNANKANIFVTKKNGIVVSFIFFDLEFLNIHTQNLILSSKVWKASDIMERLNTFFVNDDSSLKLLNMFSFIDKGKHFVEVITFHWCQPIKYQRLICYKISIHTLVRWQLF